MAVGGNAACLAASRFCLGAAGLPGYFEFHSGFLPIFNLNNLMRHLVDFSWAPTLGQPFDLLRGKCACLSAGRAAAPDGVPSVVAVKAIFGASLVAGAFGIYGWFGVISDLAGVTGAMVYVYWPLLLATTYVRGAFAEAVFLA